MRRWRGEVPGKWGAGNLEMSLIIRSKAQVPGSEELHVATAVTSTSYPNEGGIGKFFFCLTCEFGAASAL